ncbi:MAG: M48 family metalloprotease [Lysobacter sp.]|nr:M48 family metalloprotease [Lysobacter sp.]
MIASFLADYYDGRTSRRHEVSVEVIGDLLAIRGDGVAHSVMRSLASVLPRLGSTPVRIALPDGGLLVTPDFDAVAASLGVPVARTLAHRLETHSLAVLVAMAGIALAGWFVYRDGIPWASSRIAEHIPYGIESQLAEDALDSMDNWMMQPTAIPAERRVALAAEFELLRAKANAPDGTRLEFRKAGWAGPNALALPGGVIVVTDQLVELMDDREVAAVLAHELGHVRNRHGTRHVLNNSLHAFIMMALFGDATAVAGVAATVPTVFLNTGYSRDFEREADSFAIGLLGRAERSPTDFADALEALRQYEACFDKGEKARDWGYLSTHPGLAERREAALAAAGDAGRDRPPRPARECPKRNDSGTCKPDEGIND